jgi:hypothetical protein
MADGIRPLSKPFEPRETVYVYGEDWSCGAVALGRALRWMREERRKAQAVRQASKRALAAVREGRR